MERLKRSRSALGIDVRHRRGCRTGGGGSCDCAPSYSPWVYSARERRKLRGPACRTLAEARAWRTEAAAELRRGSRSSRQAPTLRAAAEAWLAGARNGSVRNRSGDRYKPSVIRGYEAALRQRLLPALGELRMDELRRPDLQRFADQLVEAGLDPSTIRNTLMPARVLFRRALLRDEIALNPTTGLELPAVRGRRERVATPAEAHALLAALPARDRAIWAVALYAGLRRGELQALRWEDVQLAGAELRVARSWDEKERSFIDPKSAAAGRCVPMPAPLRHILREHQLLTGTRTGLVFGRDASTPFVSSTIIRRARSAWLAQGLQPIALHEARHTYASLMIRACVNVRALAEYMGHASVTTTLDRYAHLMPGDVSVAAAQLEHVLAT